MENNHLQFTIREITQQINSPKFWAGLFGVVCILAVSAPFATAEQFGNIQRFFYWLGIAVSTYFTAIFVLLLTCRQLMATGLSQLYARLISSLIAAVAVALLVLFINVIVLGIDEPRWKTLVLLGGNCMLIALAVCVIFFVAHDSMSAQQSDQPQDAGEKAAQNPVTAATFYQRLPEALGTDLISLQAQDHYVEATTTQGRELVLIRLSDAVRELGDAAGIQVHRSWWVTYAHITGQKRLKNQLHLILSDGNVVPVSRTYAAAVKAALADRED